MIGYNKNKCTPGARGTENRPCAQFFFHHIVCFLLSCVCNTEPFDNFVIKQCVIAIHT